MSSRTVGTDYIVITVKSSGNPVTQYMVVKKGDPKIVSTMVLPKNPTLTSIKYLATDIRGMLASKLAHSRYE